jgi:hypothetical protein
VFELKGNGSRDRDGWVAVLHRIANEAMQDLADLADYDEFGGKNPFLVALIISEAIFLVMCDPAMNEL